MGITPKRIAFLATGEELITGEIQDTNTTFFAQSCTEAGLLAGQRMIVGDGESEIKEGILYLTTNHSGLIIVGGLGPTSDDRTRYALAQALNIELCFHELVWEWVVTRLRAKNLHIADTNRQQALFPKGAKPFFNAHGTAAGCYLNVKNRDIFMLPGPPNECRPMFQETLLPILQQHNYQVPIFRVSWLLMGASESEIASRLDPLMENTDCQVGYRIHFPYLDIKLWSHNRNNLMTLQKKFDKILKPYVISKNKQTASEQLKSYLKQTKIVLAIEDNATFGLLETSIYTPDTKNQVNFYRKEVNNPNALNIQIEGLSEYWQNTTAHKTTFTLTLQNQATAYTITRSLLNWGNQTLLLAKEWISYEILKFLQNT